jgi:hypothetical protein
VGLAASWGPAAEVTVCALLPCMIPHASLLYHTFAPRASYQHYFAAATPTSLVHSLLSHTTHLDSHHGVYTRYERVSPTYVGTRH